MLQDQSRNRTAVPAAQPAPDVAPPVPGPARAEAGIARMLSSPPKVVAPIETELGAACIAQVERLKWWDGHPGSLAEEEGDAEMDRWGAVFRRAIEEPSAGGGDLAAKAALALFDLDKFYPQERDQADSFQLMRVIMHEIVAMQAMGQLNESGPLEDPVLAGVTIVRAAYDLAIAVFEAHRREKPGQDLPPAWSNAADAAHDAFLRLVASTAPTTLAGSQALARLCLDIREGLGVDDEHEITIVLRRIAGDPSLVGASSNLTTPVDPHPALMPEVMRLWREHQRTMSGWGAPTNSQQDKVAGAAHNAFVEACLALVELPPPETPEGFAALVTAIGLAFEGCVDEGSDETVRAFGALITAAVHASGVAMPLDWKGPLYEPATEIESGGASAEIALSTDGQGRGGEQFGKESDADPIFAAIEAHQAAYAEWAPHASAANDKLVSDPSYASFVAAAEIRDRRESHAYKDLIGTVPTTFSGLAALARYLPYVAHRNATSDAGADSDALKALVTLCSSIGCVASSAEATITAALHELQTGQIGMAAALGERRDRADKFLAMMEVDGFVPYPADKPRCLMAIELAIPLEAERLLAIAQDEFDRRVEVYADLPTPERDGHTARLRAEYRLDELADVVRGRVCDVHGSPSLFDQILTCWREWAFCLGPDETHAEREAWKRITDQRGALLDAAAALPPTMANMPTKALALAWLEYAQQWERGRKRKDYGIDGGLAVDIDTAIAGRFRLCGHFRGA